MSAFEKIIGYSSVKRELMQISDSLKNTGAYERLGVSAPRGLLLYGVPGVGKTLMASALIEESGRRTFTCRKDRPGGDFVKVIKSTYDEAAANAPSIVFLDDMDKFANGDERHPDTEEYVTVQSCIDQNRQGVFTLATANSQRSLPRSLLRAGRFDRRIEINPPTGKEAAEIISHYLSKKHFKSSIDPKAIARLMLDRSCAEIETVINEAGLYAGFRRADSITTDDFMAAYMKTVFNVPENCECDDDLSIEAARVNLSDVRDTAAQVAYHEAGHAVVAEILSPDTVTLVSVHKRGDKHGGFTFNDRGGDADCLHRAQSEIVILLGGMAALERKFGIADVGASRDLSNAFDKIRELINYNCLLGFQFCSQSFSDSEALREKQEQAAVAAIEGLYKKAKEILLLNDEFLEKTAAALSEKKLLTADDIEKIKASCRIVPVAL